VQRFIEAEFEAELLAESANIVDIPGREGALQKLPFVHAEFSTAIEARMS
jgi:hypothetical protein